MRNIAPFECVLLVNIIIGGTGFLFFIFSLEFELHSVDKSNWGEKHYPVALFFFMLDTSLRFKYRDQSYVDIGNYVTN